jgi:translation initiation factor IF-3
VAFKPSFSGSRPPNRPGGRPGGRPFRQNVKEEPYRINERILAPRVRVVGENIKVDVYPTAVAIKMAQDQGLDLVEISPNADPPVCKIIEYSKFKYEQKKKQKEIKANAQKTVVKEIRFGPNTDDHDFNFKTKHGLKFLAEGAKVKAYVHFAGRSIVYKERGEILLLKFAQALEEVGKVEEMPRLEGKRMYMMVAPKGKK